MSINEWALIANCVVLVAHIGCVLYAKARCDEAAAHRYWSQRFMETMRDQLNEAADAAESRPR